MATPESLVAIVVVLYVHAGGCWWQPRCFGL